jgi:hypothetical protein
MKHIAACLAVLFTMTASTASAQYLFMEEFDTGFASTVGVMIGLHMDTADTLDLWAFDVGFDDAELGFTHEVGVNPEFGDLWADWGQGFLPALEVAPGLIKNVGRDGGLTGIMLNPGNYELASLTFELNSGELDEATDVWIEFSTDSSFFFDQGGVLGELPVQGDGPDYGPAPLPVPALTWPVLITAALFLGLYGVRRR